MQLTNKLKYIIVFVLLLICNGCTKSTTITNLDYLNTISDELNIKEYTNNISYFIEIDNTHNSFNNIQSLVEWSVINPDDNIDFNEELNYSFIHYTYTNLFEYISYEDFIKELNDNYIVNELYDLKDIVNEDDLKEIVEYIKTKANNPIIKPNHDIEFKEEIIYVDSVNDLDNTDYKQGQLISYVEDYQTVIKRIKYEGNNIVYEDVNINEIIDNIDIENQVQLDFSQATIIDNNNNVITPKDYELTSILSHNFTYKDYYISYKFHSGTFSVHISKKGDKLNYYGDFDLYSIDTKYKFKSNSQGIEDAFLKLSYDSNISSGISIGKYYDRFSNLTFNEGDDIIDKITNSFKKRDELSSVKIPIATIKVPVPGTFIVDVVMKLQVHIYASGKVEFSLVNNNSHGFEIKNNNFRFINDINNDLDFNVRASGNATLNLLLGIELLSQDLMDIGAKVGVKGEAKSTLHIYDDNSVTSTGIDVPIDLLEEKVDDKNISFCTDLSLYYVTAIEFNSEDTIAYTLGFNNVIDILDKDNQVFNNEFTHIENYQFVEECTKNKKLDNEKLPSFESNKIELEKYQYIIKKGTTLDIVIKSLPDGYTSNDLIFESNNPNITSISNNTINAINNGNTIINIKTKDNKYKVQCHILVN